MGASFELRAILLAVSLVGVVAAAGCASVDKALFGGTGQPSAEPSTAPAPEPTDADADQGDSGAAAPAQTGASSESTAAVSTEAAGPMPGTLPPVTGAPSMPPPSAAVTPPPPPPAASASAAPSEAAAEAPRPAAPPPAPSTAPVVAPRVAVANGGAPAISPVVIAPGPDTGTPVNHTIAGLRASLQDIATRLSSTAQQYAGLRSSSAQQVSAYYQAQAQISARLQIGTTRGNPELVAQWNGAQAALDQLTANVNALGGLVTAVNDDAGRARTLLAQVQGTIGMAGATDEDHRQLGVLEDEANQVIVVLGRLARDIAADVRREAATLNTERPRLAQLANAIKTGELYASGAAPGASPPGNATVSMSTGGAGQPIVTIRFARRNTNYQKALYAALNQALQGQPMASFQVVGVSPTRASAAAMQAAQSDARRRAQEVMRTMGEMGVPPARMEIAAATDPSVSGSEVRVFLR